MTGILKFLGWASIICGLAAGIYYGTLDDPLAELLRTYDDSFRLAAALTWWISGAISGIVFFALAYILGHVEAIRNYIEQQPVSETRTSSGTYPETGKSKVTLGSVKDYKMKNID
ncbi:hypothetical protein M6D81_13950 [Paenibacillus sp. J5C_2022]|uniref:hypothetical protein n=1 Tax=Paenibacillus sp. J5C2022 TaxID=2977129 RepID=UPI0021CE2E86|nr:hypothetical protein [Paenibacillus sp. J5C2022]MCU6709796.1 hypothetical protein [Paenibacillus sp. J5C2022]